MPVEEGRYEYVQARSIWLIDEGCKIEILRMKGYGIW